MNLKYFILMYNKKIQFTVAVDIPYIDKEMQKWIYEYIRDNGFIKPNQIAVLRKRMEDENIGHSYMISILNNCIAPKKNRKVTLPEKKLKNYFPPEYSQEQMEEVIVALLEQWKKEREA